MSLNRVGLGLGGGERGSNESRTISLKRNKCECLLSPWCILPVLKTCSDAGWLICLLRSCAEWQGAYSCHQQDLCLCCSAKILVAWKGASALVLYFHMCCIKEAQLCIVYSHKVAEIRLSPGIQWDSSQKGERKKKNPVSKQDRSCFCTKSQHIVWQCFTNLFHLSLIWRHLLFPQQRMSHPAPFLELHFWVSYAAQRISTIFPLSVTTTQCISTSLWCSLICSASLRLQECLMRALN